MSAPDIPKIESYGLPGSLSDSPEAWLRCLATDYDGGRQLWQSLSTGNSSPASSQDWDPLEVYEKAYSETANQLSADQTIEQQVGRLTAHWQVLQEMDDWQSGVAYPQEG
jgi:hypothetical protein